VCRESLGHDKGDGASVLRVGKRMISSAGQDTVSLGKATNDEE